MRPNNAAHDQAATAAASSDCEHAEELQEDAPAQRGAHPMATAAAASSDCEHAEELQEDAPAQHGTQPSGHMR